MRLVYVYGMTIESLLFQLTWGGTCKKVSPFFISSRPSTHFTPSILHFSYPLFSALHCPPSFGKNHSSFIIHHYEKPPLPPPAF